MCLVEPVRRVDPGELRGRPGFDRPVRAGAAIEVGIVMQDGHAVARDPDIELQAVGACRDSEIERGERVFRAECPATPVREHQGRTIAIGGRERAGATRSARQRLLEQREFVGRHIVGVLAARERATPDVGHVAIQSPSDLRAE